MKPVPLKKPPLPAADIRHRNKKKPAGFENGMNDPKSFPRCRKMLKNMPERNGIKIPLRKISILKSPAFESDSGYGGGSLGGLARQFHSIPFPPLLNQIPQKTPVSAAHIKNPAGRSDKPLHQTSPTPAEKIKNLLHRRRKFARPRSIIFLLIIPS
jgi:hypothetical protein